MRSLLLGAVADDVTGATDLGSMLSRNGMDVIQVLGPPGKESTDDVEADAIVCALKTRTAPREQAVEESLAAARWLMAQGAKQLFFKYCSTFDSTEAGNIGPVAEALLDLVDEDLAVVCPAYPENGRTVFQGHLFVGNRLLSESGMRHHPLTPMTDANLVRFLGRQCRRPESVGLVPYEVVDRGAGAIRAWLAKLRARGVRFALVDATKADHLWSAATAVSDLRLVTGGSGIARGLPANFRRTDELPERIEARLPALGGPVAVLAGSCSEATRAQVGVMATRHTALALDPIALAGGPETVDEIVGRARAALGQGPVLIHSSAAPEQVEAAQQALGRDKAGETVEAAFGKVASGLVESGVRTFVVAGGETSGRVAAALGLRRLRIGPEIEPGVPWTLHIGDPEVRIAFKSGNFGSDDFFLKALEILEES
ncbi:MAG: four-carbon acid sugar kinase family protein [Acidobacteria bacterium]|jgi:uncharacterized protein YgbK (DUF1537 family)|nr:four-carbon acid sugar kinase family protein [Acidobacteriota bacterium]